MTHVQTFIHDPASYVHRSRLDDTLTAQLMPSLLDCRRSKRRLSDHVAATSGLEAVDYGCFESEPYRLALASSEVLTALMKYIGLAFASSHLTQVIHRDEVKAWKQATGQEGYEFAIKRAPLLVGASQDTVNRPTEIEPAGKRWLCKCLSGAPRGVIQRLRLKFSPETTLTVHANVSPDAATAFSLAKRLLVRELNPELSQCLF